MMGDACLCMDADFEETHTLKEKVIKAGTLYTCCECQDTIKVKQDYEFAQISSYGKILTYRTCIPCMNMRKDLFKCNWYYGQIWEDLMLHLEDVLPTPDDNELDDWKWLKG